MLHEQQDLLCHLVSRATSCCKVEAQRICVVQRVTRCSAAWPLKPPALRARLLKAKQDRTWSSYRLGSSLSALWW